MKAANLTMINKNDKRLANQAYNIESVMYIGYSFPYDAAKKKKR